MLFRSQVYFQVVHPVLGVVNEFVSGFHIIEDEQKQLDLQLNYPAKLTKGLKIRCKYVAQEGTGTRDIAVNFYLHKILV